MQVSTYSRKSLYNNFYILMSGGVTPITKDEECFKKTNIKLLIH